MPRSPLAYLAGIVEACDLIALALRGLNLEDDRGDPIIRAAVERQFITIGEAVSSLSRLAPVLADGISHVAMIIAFRNQLTHDYPLDRRRERVGYRHPRRPRNQGRVRGAPRRPRRRDVMIVRHPLKV